MRREAVSSTVAVPTEAQRGGDFRALTRTLTNPVDTLTGRSFTDSTGSPSIAGNVISAGCISPVARNLLPFIPISNAGPVTVLDPQPQNGDMYFQGEVIRRFSRGLSFSANYTWAKSLDLVSTNVFSRRLDNPFDYNDNKGRSDFDRKHAFVGSWMWSPVLRSDQKLAKAVFSGWTLTGIHTAQSGAPFSFRMGDDVALDGSGSRQRAMFRPNAGPLKIEHSSRADMITRYFNTDAFVPTRDVPRGLYGNSGKNILDRPAMLNNDFSVIKDIPVTERYRVQFRAEFFNIFNRVNLGFSETTGGANDPDNTVTSVTFGRIRSAGAAREMQFALKFLW